MIDCLYILFCNFGILVDNGCCWFFLRVIDVLYVDIVVSVLVCWFVIEVLVLFSLFMGFDDWLFGNELML